MNINNSTQSIQYYKHKETEKKSFINYFNFDQIFGPQMSNQEIFDDRIKDMVDTALVDK